MNMSFLNISPNLHPIDLAIIVGYLMLTIIVGIYYGRGIKTFKDFAVGNQRFGVAALTMTVFATMIGGSATIGRVGKIYEIGMVFFLAGCGGFIYQLIVAYYLSPRFTRFYNAISLGDIIESRFAKQGRLISGILVVLWELGVIAAQITALGVLLEPLIGLQFKAGVIISSFIVIVYSAYGGVRSVVMTDILQFFVLIIALPVVCIVGINVSGGYEVLLSKIPDKSYIPTTSHFITCAVLFVIWSVPEMAPDVMQRMFLSKNSNVLSRAFKLSATLNIPMYFVVLLLAIVALSLNVTTTPNQALPELINQLLGPGIKGLATAGIMAVIMSTADTNLNVACVFIVNDLVKPLKSQNFSNQKKDLFLVRILTVVLGLLSVTVALYHQDIIDSLLFGYMFWLPVIVVPIYAVLFDLPGNLRDFYRAAIAGISTFLIWSFLPLPFLQDTSGTWLALEKFTYVNSLLPAFLMNGLFFFKGKVYSVIRDAVLKERKIVKSSHSNFLSIFGPQRRTPKMWFIHTTHEAKAPYNYVGALGVAMFITPLFYFDLSQNDNLLITLKIIAGLMIWCIMLRDDWFPQKGVPFCVYWHASLFAAFTMVPCLAYVRCGLEANAAHGFLSVGQFDNFLMLVLSGIVLLSVVHRHFLSLHSLTAILFSACVSYTYAGTPFTKPVLYVAYFFTILNIMCYMLSGRVFQLQQKQIKMYRHHVAKIAHETLNPLFGQSRSLNRAKECLEDLLKTNPELAKNKSLQKAQEELTYIDSSTDQVCKFIDIYQLTVREQKQSRYPHQVKIEDFITQLLKSFPFSGNCTKEMFHFHYSKTLTFAMFINPIVLCNVVHNLMRNGHYATLRNEHERTDPPQIDVSFALKGPELEIKVKDNGCGMTPSQQHQVFNAFYTTKEEGMGVGLAFCKEAVEAAGGEIFCTSVYGQGTTFVVLLPTKDKEAQKLQDQREAEEHAEERARKEKIRQETLAYARRFIANGWSDERISRATHFDIAYIQELRKE